MSPHRVDRALRRANRRDTTATRRRVIDRDTATALHDFRTTPREA